MAIPMEVVNVIQGSQEWHEFRKENYPASEAPAMMNVGKYDPGTRGELTLVRLGVRNIEVTDYQQMIFDKGHYTEACARPIVEKLLGEPLSNVTGRIVVKGLKKGVSASLDGLTFDFSMAFEHKQWNEELAEAVRNKDLPPAYYWQLEQQLLVSGAKKVIFVTSDSFRVQEGEDHTAYPHYSDPVRDYETGEIYYVAANHFEFMYYEAVPGRSKLLIEGWKEFERDIPKALIDDPVWDSAAARFLTLNKREEELKKEMKIVSAQLDPLKGAIVSYAKNAGIDHLSGSGICVKSGSRKGSVDYGSIMLAMATKLGILKPNGMFDERELMQALGAKSIDDFRNVSSETWAVDKLKDDVDMGKLVELARTPESKSAVFPTHSLSARMSAGLYAF
ncbi:MAG: YqaJ viral recombinase family protein [Thiotrichales bacterium]|nr:YqaJ viral recombinase family protein [Thiotrichales bacterium]